MEISINPQSDLKRESIESLLELIDTPEKRRRVLTDLCTLRENLEGLFVNEDSPFKRDKAHPLYRILITSNEMIGSILMNDDDFKYQSSNYGKIVTVINSCQTSAKEEIKSRAKITPP